MHAIKILYVFIGFFLDILTNFVYLFEYLNSLFYHVKVICAALLLLCKMSGMMYSYPCCC